MLKSPITGDYYNCANKTWTKVTDRILLNTEGWDCLDSNDGEMKIGLVNDAYFVCDYYEWREASIAEETNCRENGVCIVNSTCTPQKQGIFKNFSGETKVCVDGTWRAPNCAEIATGSLCTANDSSLVEACEKVGGFDIDYVCSDNHWHAVTRPFEYTLEAWKAKRDAYNAAAVEAGVNSDSMITDPRDGKTYRTVVINGLRVFAENLCYVDSITSVNLKGQTGCYMDETKNCEIGGAYYYWTAAMDLDSKWRAAKVPEGTIQTPHQGICPTGWHIPTNDEWNSLFSGIDYAAQQMIGFSQWTKATDASGFSALPVGAYNGFIGGVAVLFWSTFDEYAISAGGWILGEGEASLYTSASKGLAYSVRCIQDYPTEP